MNRIPYTTTTGQAIEKIVYSPEDMPTTCEECQFPAKFIVGGAPLCNRHFNHPNVQCPRCGFREFGRVATEHDEIACQRCGNQWKIEPDERADPSNYGAGYAE